MELLRDFKGIGKDDVHLAGGKGASLGEMTQAGIPVPPGFVLLASAFEKFLEETDLNIEIDSILASVNHQEMHTVENASEKIQSLIVAAKMPQDIRDEITRAFEKLGTKFVAVRSSATAEDSASAAWAGQLDTFLNTTEGDLLENVQKCWASLFTPRAIFYRFEKGLHTQKISVAVVVQKMVASEVSGIAFSVHPVTEDYNQMIIEAGFGLGEAIVSGQITPDSYVVEKEPRRIIDTNIAEQTRGLFRKSSGGNGWKELAEEGKRQALSNEQILELSEIIIKIESHYGFPCDIEWAFERGEFYIVQSRPITTLSAKSAAQSPDVLPEWRSAFMLGNQDVDTSFLTLEMTWAGMFDERIKEQIGVPVPDTFEEIIQGTTINTYALAAPVASFVEKAAIALQTKPELLNSLKQNTIKSTEEIREFANLHVGKLETYDVKKLAELLLDIRKLQSACVAYGTVVAWADITGAISQKLLDIINKRESLKYPRHRYSHVLSSPDTPSLTEQAVADIKKGGSDDELLKKYYWLNQGYIGSGLTLEQLQAVRHQTVTLPKNEISATVQELRAELRLSPEEEQHFKILRDIIFMKSLRADSRQFLHVVTSRIAERLGQHWNIDPELVGVMHAQEIFDLVEQDESLPDNLSLRFARSVLIPKDGTYKVLVEPEASHFIGEVRQRETIAKSDSIQGQTAYQGVVRGKVKLVFGPQHNDKIKEGDILVSTATSPQLLPGMMRAAAFVTDVGGVTSHAAIVARELKKPCVVGTKYATQVLNDGDLIEVDADRGIINILNHSGDKETQSPDIKLDPKDYSYNYGGGAIFICQDLISKYYFSKGLRAEFATFVEDNKSTTYLSKRTFKRLNEAGLSYTLDKITEVNEKFLALMDRCKRETEELKKASTVDKDKCNEVFSNIGLMLELYAFFDFRCWDGVFEQSKSDPEKKKLVDYIQKFKNELKLSLGFIVYERDGYLFTLLDKISKAHNITVDDLSSCSIENIYSVLDNQDVSKHIENNKRLSCFVGDENSYRIYSDSSALWLWEKFNIDKSNKTVFYGKVANVGKPNVTGKVFLIQSYVSVVEVNKYIAEEMQEGDILVSETTSPEIILAFKKASAVITDTGGLLSHAAITSRELGLTCLIDTGDASKHLKNGDVVEVDTDRGSMRIIDNRARKGLTEQNIVEDVKNTEWHHDWKGPFSMPEITVGSNAYFGAFKEIFGKSVSKIFLTYEKGIVSALIPLSEYEDLGTYLAEKALNHEYVKKWIQAFKKSADDVIGAMKTTPEDFLNNIDHHIDLQRVYGVYQVATKMAFDFLPPNTPKEIQDLLIEARKYSESFYKDYGGFFARVSARVSELSKYSPELVSLMTIDEIKNFSQSGVLPKEEALMERKHSGIYWNYDGICFIKDTSVKEIEEYWKKDLSTTELRGTSTYKGIVKGKCRIIHNYHGASLEKGEILVTGMTDPNFVPLMKNAGAIITDGGGMLCHAAIVSRELKIPCVVGTKFATQILHDGDLVEVDADNGIVKILKSSNTNDSHEPILLSKIFSRERGLWYGFLWNESDRMGYEKYLGHKVKNNIILREGRLTVWYDQNELDEIHSEIKERFSNDKKLFQDLVSDLRMDWTEVLPILSGEIKITSSKQLQKYYTQLVSFWASMNVLYVLPNLSDTHESLKEEALAIRTEAEKYSSNMELVWLEFWSKEKPNYFDIAELMTPDEAFEAAEKGLSDEKIKDIKKRELGSLLLNGVLYPSSELEEVLKSNNLKLEKEDAHSLTEIKGTSAFKGKVRGKVKIISLRKDISNLNDGEILVTEMTDPEYVPAIKKAAAIITDEGGVTCHAAIAAREMKKPTIIGTRIATQILKDGDMVEVDADNGVVRILGRRPTLESKEGWRFWGRWKFPVFVNSPYEGFALSDKFKELDLPVAFEGRVLSVDGYIYAVEDDHKVFDKFIKEKFASDHSWFDRFFDHFEQNLARIKELKRDEDLVTAIKLFEALGCLTMVIHFCDKGLEDIVPEIAITTGLSSDEFARVMVPFKPTYTMEYKIALHNSKGKHLDKILEMYDWVGTGYIEGKKLTEKDLREELEKLDESEFTTDQIDLSHLAKNTQAQILILQKLIYWRSANAELANMLLSSQWGAMDTLAAQHKVTKRELGVLTPSELARLELEDILPEDFQWRLDNNGVSYNGMSCTDGEFKLYFGDALKNIVQIFAQETVENQTSVKGTIAFKGKVTGVVKIVEGVGDLQKIKEGDIIISPETMPDYIIGMKKAAAFVTNQGGITSHAAIVARELRKPCIIGTKNATRVFKDGDLVEVDADNGIVKIIK